MAEKTRLSIPKNKKVCGYEIKKMPIGAYISAMDILKGFPGDFVDACFPGLMLKEIIDKLSIFDDEMLKKVIYNVFTSAPEYLINIISELTKISRENLINDENIGLDGLIDILDAFIEANNLGKFLQDGKELVAKIKIMTKTENIGFKG